MFDLQPSLSDELVSIRPLSKKDKKPLYEVASDPLIWQQHQVKDRWTKPVFDRFFEESIQSGGALVVLDQVSNQLIGSTRFNRIKNSKNAIEIGWSFLSRDYWGGKYNQSIKSLLINYAFQYVEQIIFYIDQHNLRSQKAVQKLGAIKLKEYPHPHPMMTKGETFIYMIDKRIWEANQKL